jgi:hypothetical protein
VLPPCQQRKLAGGTEDKEHAMSQKLDTSIAVIGIAISVKVLMTLGSTRCF